MIGGHSASNLHSSGGRGGTRGGGGGGRRQAPPVEEGGRGEREAAAMQHQGRRRGENNRADAQKKKPPSHPVVTRLPIQGVAAVPRQQPEDTGGGGGGGGPDRVISSTTTPQDSILGCAVSFSQFFPKKINFQFPTTLADAIRSVEIPRHLPAKRTDCSTGSGGDNTTVAEVYISKERRGGSSSSSVREGIKKICPDELLLNYYNQHANISRNNNDLDEAGTTSSSPVLSTLLPIVILGDHIPLLLGGGGGGANGNEPTLREKNKHKDKLQDGKKNPMSAGAEQLSLGQLCTLCCSLGPSLLRTLIAALRRTPGTDHLAVVNNSSFHNHATSVRREEDAVTVPPNKDNDGTSEGRSERNNKGARVGSGSTGEGRNEGDTTVGEENCSSQDTGSSSSRSSSADGDDDASCSHHAQPQPGKITLYGCPMMMNVDDDDDDVARKKRAAKTRKGTSFPPNEEEEARRYTDDDDGARGGFSSSSSLQEDYASSSCSDHNITANTIGGSSTAAARCAEEDDEEAVGDRSSFPKRRRGRPGADRGRGVGSQDRRGTRGVGASTTDPNKEGAAAVSGGIPPTTNNCTINQHQQKVIILEAHHPSFQRSHPRRRKGNCRVEGGSDEEESAAASSASSSIILRKVARAAAWSCSHIVWCVRSQHELCGFLASYLGGGHDSGNKGQAETTTTTTAAAAAGVHNDLFILRKALFDIDAHVRKGSVFPVNITIAIMTAAPAAGRIYSSRSSTGCLPSLETMASSLEMFLRGSGCGSSGKATTAKSSLLRSVSPRITDIVCMDPVPSKYHYQHRTTKRHQLQPPVVDVMARILRGVAAVAETNTTDASSSTLPPEVNNNVGHHPHRRTVKRWMTDFDDALGF